MAAGYDGSIRIKALLNHTQFDRGVRSIRNSIQTLQNTLWKFAGIVGAAFGVAAIVNFGRESVKAASELNDAWLGLQSIVEGQGRSFHKAQSFIESYISDGLVPLTDAVTAYKNLSARGYNDEQIQKTMTALKDAAAFGRQSTYSLGEAVASAAEGLKNENSILVDNAGVTKNVAKMWDEYAKSIGTTANNLTQEQKIQAEVNGILEETRFQTGDAAKLVNTYSGQIAMLGFNFQQLKVQVGNAIMPIVQAVLPGINAIISALVKLAKVFAKVTALLFGKANVGSSGQVSANEQIASSGLEAADATDKLAESTSGAGSASKKAAKDMKGVLAGFDELNILADKASNSVSGAAGGLGDGGGEIEIPEVDLEGNPFENLEESISSLGELFVKTLDDMLAGIPALKEAFLDFASGFNDFNQTLYDAFTFPGVLERVEELGRQLAGAFNDLVNAIDWEPWGRRLGAGLNLALQFLTEFLYAFNWVNLGQKLAEFINGIVYEVDWYDFGRLLFAKFKIALETLAGLITGLDMPAIAQAASNIIMGFFDEMKNTIARIDWAEIGRQVARFLANIDWVGILSSVWGAVKEAILAGFEFLAGVIEEGSPGLLAAISVVAGILGAKFAAAVVPMVVQVGKTISSVFRKIKDVSVMLKYEMANLSGAIKAVFGPGSVFAGIGMVVGGAALAFTNFFSMLKNGFSWANETLMLLGTAITAIGATILGVSAPVAAGIAAVVAVAGTLAAVLLGGGEAAYKASEDFQVMEGILGECEESSKRSENALKNLSSNIENLNTSMSDIGAAQSLVEEIYAINENADASAQELELMATKVDLLNSMGLDGLHLTIDETTGRIVETKEATDQLIASLQKEAETAALQELLIQAYKDRYQAVSDAEQAVKNINTAEQALKETEEQLTNTPWWDLEKHTALTEQQKKQTEALEAATDARNGAIIAYDELSGAIDTYAGSLTNLSEPEANVGVQLESRMDSVRQTVEGVAADMPGYGKNIGEGLENGMSDGIKEEETKGIFSRIGDWFKELFGINSPSKVFSEYGGFLMEGLSGGIGENIPSVEEQLSSFLHNTETSISSTWANVESDTSTKWGNIKDELGSKYSSINSDSDSGFKTIKDTIIGKIDATMSELLGKDWLSIGKRIVDGVMDGLSNIFTRLRNWASSVMDTIGSVFSSADTKARRFTSGMNAYPRMVPSDYVEYAALPARSLPKLANGAVIPPNQQFAAILGDQRKGYNIEAPAELIRQMVMEGIQAAGGVGNGSGNMTVIMEIDGREFGRASYKYGSAERQRVGVQLARGTT